MYRPLEPGGREDGVTQARGNGDGALREERHLAGPLVLPDRERDERRCQRDREEDGVPPAPREEEGEGGPGEEDDVGRLDRERHAGERPGENRLSVRPGLERPNGQRRGDEDGYDRREVRLLREPERLREDLVDPAVVVPLNEVRNRYERSRDEHGGAPEPRETPGEARTDVVHGERRDRA